MKKEKNGSYSVRGIPLLLEGFVKPRDLNQICHWCFTANEKKLEIISDRLKTGLLLKEIRLNVRLIVWTAFS